MTVDKSADKDKKSSTEQKNDDKTNVDDYIPTPPDGGYGWIIVIASFCNHIIVDGIAFSFGVFYDDFLDYFDAGSGQTALVGSLLSGFYLLAAPVASACINKYGCRPVATVGAFVATVGFVLSTLSTSITHMMLSYGLVGGIGLGLLYLPNVIAVSYYFQRRRALATGIAVCGTGVGCFIMAPLGKFLLATFAWRGAMLIVAGITLQGCFFSSLLRPLEAKASPHKRKSGPRRKNWFDRLRERLGCAASETVDELNTEHKEKVHEAKSKRHEELNREEFEHGHSASNEKLDIMAMETNDKKKEAGIPVSITVETDLNSPTDQSEKQQLLGDVVEVENGKLAIGENETIGDKARKELSKPQLSQSQLRCVSDLCLAEKNGKLPDAVDKADLSKPLYRRDIFYSGSMLHVAEFKSHPNMTQLEYTREVTAVPVDDYNKQYKLCHCIPVSRTVYHTMKEMFDVTLLKDPLLLIPCLTNLFGAVGLFIPFVYIVPRAVKLGIEASQASLLLSVIGVTNTLGRLVAGTLADFSWVNTLLLHNIALVFGGILCILHMFCNEYVSMCIYAALFGLCIATWISLTSIVLCELLGLEKLTKSFGFLTMTRGIATFIGTPMAGFIYDNTLNYNNCFQVGGVMLLAGGLLCCSLHLPCFHKTAGKKAPKSQSAAA